MGKLPTADAFEQEIEKHILSPPADVKIGVVGPMDFPDLDAVRRYIRSLPEGTTVVSGGRDARNKHGEVYGVESTAIDEAEHQHLRTEVHLLHWKLHGTEAVAVHNDAIVAACDKLLAFWHRDGDSETADAISRAEQAGKPIRVRGVGFVLLRVEDQTGYPQGIHG